MEKLREGCELSLKECVNASAQRDVHVITPIHTTFNRKYRLVSKIDATQNRATHYTFTLVWCSILICGTLVHCGPDLRNRWATHTHTRTHTQHTHTNTHRHTQDTHTHAHTHNTHTNTHRHTQDTHTQIVPLAGGGGGGAESHTIDPFSP